MAGLLDGIPSSEVQSSTVSGTTGQFSTVTNSNGTLSSPGVGSPITYGAIVQAGTAGPLLAATGSIVFGRQFSDESFITTITCQRSGTLFGYIVSGTGTYTISGITIGGQSGLAYNWVAVGA